MKKKAMLPTLNKVMYSSGSLGYSVVQQSCNGLIIYFGMVSHNVPPILMGIAVALGIFWDAIADPFVGFLSDKTDSILFGRRYGFIAVASFSIAIINIALWNIPMQMHVAFKFIWFLLAIMLINTFQSFFQTPYHTLGLELCGDYEERQTLEIFKTIAQLAGLAIPTVVMGFILSDGANPEQYLAMSYITSIIILITGLTTVLGTYSHQPRLKAKAKTTERKQFNGLKRLLIDFFALLENKNFRSCLIGYAVSLMSLAFVSSLGIYVFKFVFLLEFSMISWLFGAMFAVTIISQPLWIKLVKKFEKRPVLISGLICAIVATLYLILIFVLYQYAELKVANVFWIILPGMSFFGVGIGVIFALPKTMIGDLLAIHTESKHDSRKGTFQAYLTFAYKISQAVTLVLVGILLQCVGLNTGLPAQSFLTTAVLGWMLLAGMLVSLSVGLFMYWAYSIKESDVPKELSE